MESRLEANWRAVKQRIALACERADRDPAGVELLAVTKKVSPPLAAALCALGQADLAENRAAELERKNVALAQLGHDPHWHFIGTLQRNKARRVVQRARTVHSVDSLRLLEHLAQLASELEVRPDLYLQVNVSDESEKHGFLPRDLEGVLAAARELRSVEIRGLMGMAPRMSGASESEKRAAARASFDRLVALGEAHRGAPFAEEDPRYSMGMSGDLEEAIAAGAHVVRIGTALFEGIQDEEAA